MFFRIPEEINGAKDKIYILDTKCADVNGDGLNEIITVTGKKTLWGKWVYRRYNP